MPAALFESDVSGAKLAAGTFDLAAAGFEFLRHAVKRAHQVADFVRGAYVYAIVEAATRDFLRSFRQRYHRACDQLGKKQRQPCSREQDQAR